MDILTICFVTLLVVCLGGAQQQYELTVDPQHVYVKEGDTTKEFFCTINQRADFLISHPLKWEKVSRDGTVQTISVLANVVPGLENEYSVTLPPADVKMVFKLTFLQGIKNEYDGHFRCALYGSGTNILAEAMTEVHVLKNFKNMQFKIGDKDALTTPSAQPVSLRLEEGPTDIMCLTEGSNPAPKMSITINGQAPTNTALKQTDVEIKTDVPYVYNSQIKGKISLMPSMNGQILKCSAIVKDDDSMKAEMSFLLDVFTITPELSCKNVSAVQGDLFVILECSIRLKGIACQSADHTIFWENGNTGEQFKTDSEESNYIVLCDDTQPDEVITKFKMNRVSSEDFKTDYFVVYVNKHKTSKRVIAPLYQNHNSGVGVKSAIYLLCISFVTALML